MAKDSERFWIKVDKCSESECWEWKAGKDKDGYGRFRFKGVNHKAHRVSWIFHFADPEKQCVLHKCDNPGCVNPSHLFLGSRQDNNQDMMDKGRSPIIGKTGQENVTSKLTEAQVLFIKKHYKPYDRKFGCRALGRKFNVCHQTISAIVTERSWSHR